jgi:hypothetical protein
LQPANLVAFGFSLVLRLVSGVGGFSAGVTNSRCLCAALEHGVSMHSINHQSSINQSNITQTNKQTQTHSSKLIAVLCVVAVTPSRLTNRHATILDSLPD